MASDWAKSDWQLRRERDELRDRSPFSSLERDQDAEDRLRAVNRELERSEERQQEEAREEQQAHERAMERRRNEEDELAQERQRYEAERREEERQADGPATEEAGDDAI